MTIDPDALALLEMLATDPTLDRITALPPERFRDPKTREKHIERLRQERTAWEFKRGDRTAPSLDGDEE